MITLTSHLRRIGGEMKNKAILLAIFALSACRPSEIEVINPIRQENDPESSLKEYVLTAYQEGATRTTLVDQTKIYWKPGDEIKVFCAGESAKFTSMNQEDASVAEFRGLLSVEPGDVESDHPLVALYPYREDAFIQPNGNLLAELHTYLPYDQIAQENSFSDDLYISYGLLTDNELQFQNACSGIRFSVTTPGINEVQLQSLDYYEIAGDAIIFIYKDGSRPSIVGKDLDSGKRISLRCPEGQSFIPGSWYFIVTRPCSFTNGFDLTFIKDGEKGRRVFNQTVDCNRSRFVSISEADRGVEFIDKESDWDPALIPDNEIWYVCRSGETISVAQSSFDATILSNEIVGGKGVIRFSEPVTRIRNAFHSNDLNRVLLPKTISVIGDYAFEDCRNLEDVNIPESCTHIGSFAFSQCLNMQEITFPEALQEIGQYAFRYCKSIKEVTIPSSVINLAPDAFVYCYSVEHFYGKYSSEDHLGLIIDDGSDVIFAQFALGSGLEEYTVPSGVTVIGSFARDEKIKKVFLPEGVRVIGDYAFETCSELREINFPESVESIGVAAFASCFYLDNIIIPDACKSIGELSFIYTHNLQNLHIGKGITSIPESAFYACTKLVDVTIPEYINSIGKNAFGKFPNDPYISVHMRAVLPPYLGDSGFDDHTSVIYVPEESVEIYKKHPFWNQFKDIIQGYPYDDLDDVEYDYYVSRDYSKDGEVTQLRSATEGNGVDVVFLGDGFSDRQIEDGTYRQIMQDATDAMLSEEPYNSFKDLFNVYAVNVVSPSEGYDNTPTSLSTFHGGGSYVDGNQEMILSYARKAVSDDRMDETLIIVIMNENSYGGTTFMFKPDDISTDYGSGCSIAIFPVGNDPDTFAGLIRHEAGGHGFAKLADEYYYGGTTPTDYDIQGYQGDHQYGWYMNLDFTTDENAVVWSDFLHDPRYEDENIGIYEGALFEYGAYKPTQNSIMMSNYGGYNAPSRKAIWYRIHKLAYGATWNGTYEDFVAADMASRTPASIARRNKQSQSAANKNLPPLSAPVVINHSWRDLQ